MSYIESNNNSFVNIKLTEKGREKLAKGQLTFNSWAIGDSEVNYNREELVDAGTLNVDPLSKILRPKDRQPNLKYFITTGVTSLNPLTSANIKTLKAVVNNEATQRGFFSGTTFSGGGDFSILTGSPYTRSSGTLPVFNFTGGTTLQFPSGNTRDVGDVIMFQFVNDSLTGVTTNSPIEPIPSLWYKVQSANANEITVDRTLPDLSGVLAGDAPFFVYPSGETSTAFGTGTTSAYWDTGTLSFNSSCDISVSDVPVWNQNNVWGEDLAGLTGTAYENYTKFGSYGYLGSKDPYLGYGVSGLSTDITTPTEPCPGFEGFEQLSVIDAGKKSIALIHYTNNTISNFYGEFFHIDNSKDKTLRLDFPTLMYHRRSFTGGTGTGDKMGMSFLASGVTQFVGSGTSAIEFVDLIEDADLVSSTPRKVGRVFPQLKIVAIDDEEIVAALSYKSNRNWTLPELATQMKAPSGASGVLANGKTMYTTYILENSGSTGIKSALPCQKYTKITNTTGADRDVEFRINASGVLPYMRKIESGWDGRGFYATNFKLLYQIVDSSTERPDPELWKVHDFTSTGLTSAPGETIDPTVLENQNPTANGFILDPTIDSATTVFDLISVLDLPANASPEILQFGDEKFMYGNLNTYIGATIYKTIFDIRVNSSMFNKTTNPTRSQDASTNPPPIRVTDVGIYDSNQDLVLIGKLSQPVKLEGNSTIILELAIDF